MKWWMIRRGSSSYAKEIADHCGIKIIKTSAKAEDPNASIINYGLTGEALEYMKEHTLREKFSGEIRIINQHITADKYEAIIKVRNSIPTPITVERLNRQDLPENFLLKRRYSFGGYGIRIAQNRIPIPGMYYQQRIVNRPYELRILAFDWLPSNLWPIYKRIGPEDQVTWNHHQGGRFITVNNPERYGIFQRAREYSLHVLSILNMNFGAIDFVVDESREPFFIEINSAPGWTTLSKDKYLDAFNKLINGA